MKRGDVVWVNFDPSVGGEFRKRRPAIVVSNDAANRFLNQVQVIPLTSRTAKIYPSEAFVTVQGKQRKAMADQLTTVSKERVGSRIGVISANEMARTELAIRIQLGLEHLHEAN